jgi:hypothetical protein
LIELELELLFCESPHLLSLLAALIPRVLLLLTLLAAEQLELK